VLPLLLVGLTACTSTPLGDSASPDDIALSWQVAAAERSPTTLVLSWDANAPADSLAVEVDTGDDVERHALDPGAGRHLLAGYLPDHDLDVRMVGQHNGHSFASSWQPVHTGAVPVELPSITVDVDSGDALDGRLLLLTQVQSPPAAFVLDEAGHIVWWRIMDDDAWSARARLSRDGQTVLVNHGIDEDDDQPGVRRFSLDGELVDDVLVNHSHRDFVELPDGTLTMLVKDERDVDGQRVIGDGLVEVTPDGDQRAGWSAWDSFTPDLDAIGRADGWTHANHLDYDEATDSYLVTLSHMHAVAAIDRQTATADWVFGGPASDFATPAGDSEPLDGVVHGVHWIDNELLIFENFAERSSDPSSAVAWRLDPHSPDTKETWRWTPDPPVYTATLGNVRRLDSGDTLVNFATSGRIAVVAPDGSVRWQVSTAIGEALGYAVVMDGLR